MDLVDEIIWRTFERRVLPETNVAEFPFVLCLRDASALLVRVTAEYSPSSLFFSFTGVHFLPEPKILRNKSQMGPSQEKPQGEQYDLDSLVQ